MGRGEETRGGKARETESERQRVRNRGKEGGGERETRERQETIKRSFPFYVLTENWKVGGMTSPNPHIPNPMPGPTPPPPSPPPRLERDA